MYNNESYDEEVMGIRTGVKELESAWVATNPERAALVTAYPSPVRPHQKYWANSPPPDTVIPQYPPCPRCKANEFRKEKVLEGVRHNGDGYGAFYETCTTCGWTVWWLYDES